MRTAHIGFALIFAGGDARLERGADGVRHRIDRMTLSAAVLVVDPTALVMALDEPCPHQLRYRAADRRHAGFPDALTDLCVNETLGLVPVIRQFPFGLERRPYL